MSTTHTCSAKLPRQIAQEICVVIQTGLGVILEPSEQSSWSRAPELDDGEEYQGGGVLFKRPVIFATRF